jgi:hypothetical protein
VYYSGDQIEKNEMGGHVERLGEERWWGNLRERYHLEDSGVDAKIILRRIFRKWDGGMNWIDLAMDRDRWRALVNAATNLRVP